MYYFIIMNPKLLRKCHIIYWGYYFFYYLLLFFTILDNIIIIIISFGFHLDASSRIIRFTQNLNFFGIKKKTNFFLASEIKKNYQNCYKCRVHGQTISVRQF